MSDDHARLHDNEIAVDDGLARGLISSQFPQWADLPLRRMRSSGTVNAIFRLGDDLVVRLPRTPDFANSYESIDACHRWLDWARPRLPLRIPEPVAIGEPSESYPFPWPVHRWIEGQSLGEVDLSDSLEAARRLGEFVNALHALPEPPADAPRSVKAMTSRRAWEPVFRQVLPTLADVVDTDSALAAWDETVQVPSWTGPSTWVHADLLRDNLLATRGELNAVIDFECYGTGDPALDLTAAWCVFSPRARAVFRGIVEADEDTWQRARNHALGSAMGARYYESTNPSFAAMCLRALREAVADF